MLKNIVRMLAALTTSLSAGLLFGYACSVNPGLHRLPDTAYLSAMQEINLAIQNPVFFFVYFSPLVLLPVAAAMASGRRRAELLAAAVVYACGVAAVTVLGNVALNNQLASFDVARANEPSLADMRERFEGPWGGFHYVRTCCAVIAAGLSLMGIGWKDGEKGEV